MYLRNNSELCHYGVLGMKWGVCKARKKAQKENVKGRAKQSTGKNYDEAVTNANKEMLALRSRTRKKTDSETKNYYRAEKKQDINGLLDAEKNLADIHTDYMRQRSDLIKRAQRSINEASLRDAGYSEKEVQRGG